MLPRLAAFAPERFAQDYLTKCIAHLLAVLKHTGERGTAFAALADMAGSLAAVGCQDGFEPYLPAIAAQASHLASHILQMWCPVVMQLGQLLVAHVKPSGLGSCSLNTVRA